MYNKMFTNEFKSLFKKVTGLNIINLDKIVELADSEKEAKEKIEWMIKSGVISKKEDIQILINKLQTILDDDASTVDSWEIDEDGESSLDI